MSETNQTNDLPVNPTVHYEEQDVNLSMLLISAVALLVLTVVAMILAFWYLGGLQDYRTATEPTPLPLIELRPTPPLPRLQPNPIDRQTAEQDLEDLRAREDAILNSYGWVDEEAGIVRIPVDQAIEILSEEEEPAR